MSRTYSDAMVGAESYNRWVLDQFRASLGTRVVEIGLGHGGFFKLLPDGIRYWGVDIDAEVVAGCRALFPGNAYHLLDVTTPVFAEFCRQVRADTILCFNVLEHIADDALAVERMLQGLQAGGMVHLFVPAHAVLYNDLDRLAGHLRRYDRRRLRSVLPREGVEVVRLEYFNPIGGLGWLANRLVRHASLDADRVNTQIRVYERYLLPVSRALNPMTKRHFGQSLLALLRKVGGP